MSIDRMLERRYLNLRIAQQEFGATGFDPSDFIHESEGVIRLSDPDGGRSIPVGNFSVIQVDADGALTQGESLYYVFDTYQVTFDYYQYLYRGAEFTPAVVRALGGQYPWSRNLLILDRLTIEPKFRGHQFGLIVLNAMIRRFWIGAGLVALKAFPLQFEHQDEPDELRKRGLDMFKGGFNPSAQKLRHYYARLGFKLVRGTPYMVRSVEMPLPERDL